MKIYIDENLPHQLAEGISVLEKPLGEDVEVLSIKKVFGQGSKDEEWIPIVGKEGGIVITQDFNIHTTRHQKELYMEYGVGIFFFKPPSKKPFKYWEMVEQIIKRWDRLKKIAKKTKKPFAFRCTSRKDFEQIE